MRPALRKAGRTPLSGRKLLSATCLAQGASHFVSGWPDYLPFWSSWAEICRQKPLNGVTCDLPCARRVTLLFCEGVAGCDLPSGRFFIHSGTTFSSRTNYGVFLCIILLHIFMDGWGLSMGPWHGPFFVVAQAGQVGKVGKRLTKNTHTHTHTHSKK